MSAHKMNITGAKDGIDISDDIIGIDLGTTNSAVAVYSANTVPTLLPIGGPGKFTIPSCVRWDGFNEEREPIFTVGKEAYKERYAPNVIYSIKRMMGSGKRVDFHARGVKKLEDGASNREVLTSTPAYISSLILSHIKEKVWELYKPVTKCIITVPAYFNQRQIEDTSEAAKYAGLECVQILKEPTSASYIYSLLGYANNGTVLIYDLGGGTFDVTHMRFLRKDNISSKLLTSLRRQYGIELNADGADANDQYFCRVLGTYGDVHLGGDDIDTEMAKRVVETTGVELSEEGMEQLILKCEEFKKLGVYGMDIELEGQKIHLSADDLNYAVDAIFERTLKLMEDISMEDVGTIVLVGGSTKSQRIRDNLAHKFPNVEISAVLDPDATVALGAGSVAKAVANKKGLMYSDVLPLPIGILVDETKVDVCIPRNTSMPHTVSRSFRTMHDKQERITLHVYQGLSSQPEKCTYLGKLCLEGIPQAPAGDVSVQVFFTLTGQGRLRITSKIDGEGAEREEELVIDNIFDVSATAPVPAMMDVEDTDEGQPMDDFESCFMPLLKEDAEAMALFAERRTILHGGSSDVTEIEDKIVSRLS